MERVSLKRIEVENFRSLKKVAVDLGPMRVLVGPNGAGKSNLLAAIRFLGDVAREDIARAVELHGGFESILFRGKLKTPRIQFKVIAQVTEYSSHNATDEYTLGLWRSRDMVLRRENFVFKRTPGAGRRIEVSGAKVDYLGDSKKARTSLSSQSAALSTLPRLGDDAGGKQVKALADLFTTFRVFDVDVVRAREPARRGVATALDAGAANLAPFLHWLMTDVPETFDLLEDDLRAVVPGFRRFSFELLGGPAAGVLVSMEEQGLSGLTPLADASFGTVRALALLAMLHDPNPPKLTCIEEVDHGLHPHAIDKIVERMRAASTRTQLLVATHSPTFVNRLEPEELIVCERDEETGASIIPAVDPADVAQMVAASELRLGELWFTGALGGALP